MKRALILTLAMLMAMSCITCPATVALADGFDSFINMYNRMLPSTLEVCDVKEDRIEEAQALYELSYDDEATQRMSDGKIYSTKDSLFLVCFPNADGDPEDGFYFGVPSDDPELCELLFRPFMLYFCVSCGISDVDEINALFSWLREGPEYGDTMRVGSYTVEVRIDDSTMIFVD